MLKRVDRDVVVDAVVGRDFLRHPLRRDRTLEDALRQFLDDVLIGPHGAPAVVPGLNAPVVGRRIAGSTLTEQKPNDSGDLLTRVSRGDWI